MVKKDHECHKPKFRFKSIKTDEDIKKQFQEVTSMIDTTPNVPMYKAWDMRARNKSKDLGPEFKHAAKTQLNWINENIKRNTLSYFKVDDVTSEGLESQIRSMLSSGRTERRFRHINPVNLTRSSKLAYNHPVPKGEHFF